MGNLFLTRDYKIVLGDFGLSTLYDPYNERKKVVCGTPNYIAPEIIDRRNYSFEVDVWSTGVLAYFDHNLGSFCCLDLHHFKLIL